MAAVPLPDSPIRPADAVGIALELCEHHLFLQSAMLLDENLFCRDVISVRSTGDTPWHSHLDARTITTRLLSSAFRPSTSAMVAITVGVVDTDVIYEADLEHYRATTALTGACGIRLLDWIVTDGDVVRSYAEITGIGWAVDPS